jgi:hypothetical protein
MGSRKQNDVLSTPSLGITILFLLVRSQVYRGRFQLPLSGSHSRCLRGIRKNSAPLSTPSLGITSHPILFRADELELLVERELSTPSLGITGLEMGWKFQPSQSITLSTPSLGITRRAWEASRSGSIFQLPLSGSRHLDRPRLESRRSFNSLSRDHMLAPVGRVPGPVKGAFNSLSRDHKALRK